MAGHSEVCGWGNGSMGGLKLPNMIFFKYSESVALWLSGGVAGHSEEYDKV